MPDLNKIIEDLSSLTVAEAADLSKQLEEKWGVTPMAAAAPAAAAGGEAAADKDDFTIMLLSSGDKKINVIKEVRAATSLGLKEAKDLVEGAPKEVKAGVPKKEAEEIKAKPEAAGAVKTSAAPVRSCSRPTPAHIRTNMTRTRHRRESHVGP